MVTFLAQPGSDAKPRFAPWLWEQQIHQCLETSYTVRADALEDLITNVAVFCY